MSELGTDDVLPEDMPPNVIAVIGMKCKFPEVDSVEDF